MDRKNLQFARQGIINLESGSYIFRGDIYAEQRYWAWKIEPVLDIGGRSQCYKWEKLPKSKKSSYKGDVVLFNIDNPPPTVNWTPLLD